MLEKKNYTNGQKVYELIGDKLTYFYKNGKVKAEGPYIKGMMEGEWKFYRENGQFWQLGNFKHEMKHGSWIRYDRNDKVEYQESFIDNKIVKK